MKLYAVVPIHYGSDYLQWAIRSVYDVAYEIGVFIMRCPWQDVATLIPRLENDDEIERIARSYDPENKIYVERLLGFHFQEDQWIHLTTRAQTQGAEWVLRLPPDEVWPRETLDFYLEYADFYKSSVIKVPRRHFWRSFQWSCSDNFRADRFIRCNGGGEAREGPEMRENLWHFGYARKPYDILYRTMLKWYQSGWRNGWFEGTFLQFPNRKADLHPFAEGIWNATAYDPKRFPAMMEDHPYWPMAVIE